MRPDVERELEVHVYTKYWSHEVRPCGVSYPLSNCPVISPQLLHCVAFNTIPAKMEFNVETYKRENRSRGLI